MTQQQMTHQEARRKEAEESFERCYKDWRFFSGEWPKDQVGSEQDWEHIAWEMGILDHYKRLRSE